MRPHKRNEHEEEDVPHVTRRISRRLDLALAVSSNGGVGDRRDGGSEPLLQQEVGRRLYMPAVVNLSKSVGKIADKSAIGRTKPVRNRPVVIAP